MATVRTYFPRAVRWEQLLADLVALGLPTTTPDGGGILETRTDAKGCWISYPEERAAEVAAVVAAHDAAAIDASAAKIVTDRNAARALVVQTAQTAVNVRFDQLTTAQVRALVAIMLWQAGALNGNGVVQPLAGWVR